MKKKSRNYEKKIKNGSKKVLRNILLSKTFQKSFKYTVFLLLIVALLYGFYFYLNQTIGSSVIVSRSEILNRISKQMPLPKDVLISVERVQDPDTLRSQNDFYKDIKEGDYIVIYKNEIIIYDFMKDKVVGVKN